MINPEKDEKRRDDTLMRMLGTPRKPDRYSTAHKKSRQPGSANPPPA
jgi:hypothetical protein